MEQINKEIQYLLKDSFREFIETHLNMEFHLISLKSSIEDLTSTEESYIDNFYNFIDMEVSA